jgi:hypothetical protein
MKLGRETSLEHQRTHIRNEQGQKALFQHIFSQRKVKNYRPEVS